MINYLGILLLWSLALPNHKYIGQHKSTLFYAGPNIDLIGMVEGGNMMVEEWAKQKAK